MCGQYVITHNATFATDGTEQIFIQLTPPSDVSIGLKRITLSNILVADVTYRLFVKRETTAGTGTTTILNIRKKHLSQPAGATTGLGKSGVNTFTLGTVTDTLLRTSFNGRTAFEWIPRDKNDILWSGEGVRLAITVSTPGTNGGTGLMDCEWIE